MRVVTWNCRRARQSAPLWDYFRELEPDIAVLQEVGSVPADVQTRYDVRLALPRTKHGTIQRFQTVTLARGAIGAPVPLTTPYTWVNEELEHFGGNVVASKIHLSKGLALTAVCVYSPAWPVRRQAYAGVDVSGIKLAQNPDIWVTDLLVAGLRSQNNDLADWIVGGDFNACETFDSWKSGPRGNREWLNRMAALGLTECLRAHQGRLTPTFRKPRATSPNCQLDYVFVGSRFARSLDACATGDRQRVLGGGLSDHLPVIADFAL